jgi:hypothetical protein
MGMGDRVVVVEYRLERRQPVQQLSEAIVADAERWESNSTDLSLI